MIVFNSQAKSFLAAHELSQIENDSAIEPGDIFVVGAGRVELGDDGMLVLTGHDGTQKLIGADASKLLPPPPPKLDRTEQLGKLVTDLGARISQLETWRATFVAPAPKAS